MYNVDDGPTLIYSDEPNLSDAVYDADSGRMVGHASTSARSDLERVARANASMIVPGQVVNRPRQRRPMQRPMQQQQPAQQAQQLNGGPSSEEGDAAGVPGGSVGATPGDVRAQAAAYAQQLLTMPDSQRRGLLIKIKQSNPTLHDQVMGIMTDIRSQARSQGGAMMLEQMKGQM